MMMSLIPFLVHHYSNSAVKWFSSSAQHRAAGASWDPEKGCVKTFDDEAVSWMMTEKGFSAFDQAAPDKDSPAAQRPDPSNLQAAAGVSGLINGQASVGTFASKTAIANSPGRSSSPAPLTTGAGNQRVFAHATDSVTDSVNSNSTRSSITASLFSRLSQMESTLAKVDKLDTLMTRIVNQLGLLQDPAAAPTPLVAAIPASPAPSQALPMTVNAPVAAAVPVSQSDPATVTVANTPSKPDDARPLTYEGALSNSRILAQNRQPSSEQISADVSYTDVGHVSYSAQASRPVQEDG
jgi:hypothetical protein